MSKIRQSANLETCTVRLPLICNGNTLTTVLAHVNGIRYGHGTGQKVNDLLGAYCCSACHDVLDGRVKSNFDKDFLKLCHYEGVLETLLRLKTKGLIKL